MLDDTFDADASQMEEEKKQSEGHSSGYQDAEKPITAPMPGSNFSFEAEVESALQNYVEAEHVANMLMPSINAQIPQITERQFKEYVAHDKLFAQIYDSWSSQ